jgi:DNA topoisomerase-1
MLIDNITAANIRSNIIDQVKHFNRFQLLTLINELKALEVTQGNTENIETITHEEAINILKYPKYLGKIEKTQILLCKGRFGLYIKYGKQNINIKNKNENEIDLEYIKSLIPEKKNIIKTFNIKNKIINVKKSQYNYYIQIISSNNTKQNIPIPKNYNIEKINIKEILEIISNK